MIAAGYEDGNNADSLRHDPQSKLANGRLSRQGQPEPRARTLAAARLLSNGADAPIEPQNRNPPAPRYATTKRKQRRRQSNATAPSLIRQAHAVCATQTAS